MHMALFITTRICMTVHSLHYQTMCRNNKGKLALKGKRSKNLEKATREAHAERSGKQVRARDGTGVVGFAPTSSFMA